MNKLRALLPGGGNSSTNKSDRHSINTLSSEPEVGFEINIDTSNSNNNSNQSSSSNNDSTNKIPELNVNLIGARHLPAKFGFKTVEGYMVKVKMFPGSIKYDSSIQTNSWPKFNEKYKFPLQPEKKSSLRSPIKDNSENALEKLFSGHFVVFTVYALLELPAGTFNRFNRTYRSLKEKSTTLIQKIADQSGESSKTNNDEIKTNKERKQSEGTLMTKSESKRNIGSVTCYLEPKIFKRNSRTNQYSSEEMWLPIKNLTVTTATKETQNSLSTSTKGQLEIILELFDPTKEIIETKEQTSSEISPVKKPFNFSEMKKKLTPNKSNKLSKELCLRVTTSKFRCSIKSKDEFEHSAGQIYIKTSVYEHNILLDSWKCDNFMPSLSTRWDTNLSELIIPIQAEESLATIMIKSTVATKTKMGKKTVLGTILIGPKSTKHSLEHWNSLLNSRNEPRSMWHNFE